MNSKLLIFSLILAVSLASCGSHKKTVTYKDYSNKKNKNATVLVPKEDIALANKVFKQIKAKAINPQPETLNYIENFAPLAMIEMYTYKIPASITLAQAILESNSGKSELSIKSNNHFGVKCHKDWQGKRVYHNDDKKHECFRKYSQPIGSFKDHSLFLKKGERYSFLFQLNRGDYRAWADGLKYAGYATDPHYPKKLVKIIENYHLYRYDAEVLHQEQLKKKFDKARADAIAKSDEEVKTISVADEFRLKQVNNQDPKELGKKVNSFDNVYDYYENAVKKAKPSKKPNENIVKKTNKKPVQKPIKKIVNQPNKKPVVVTNKKPINKNQVKQADKKSIKQPKEKPVAVTNEKPVKQPNKNSVKRTDKKQPNKPVDKSILKKLKKPTKPVSNDVINPVKLPTKKTIIAATDKKVNNRVKKPDLTKKAISYIVKKGDNLYAVSIKFNTTIKNLKAWNNLTSDYLKVGQEIFVKNTNTQKNVNNGKSKIYKVKKGETLYAISKKFKVRVEDLKTWNNLTSNNVQVNQELIINSQIDENTDISKNKPAINKVVKTDTYIVKKGETLYAISKKFNVTVEELKTWNNLTSNTLKVGQQIMIKK